MFNHHKEIFYLNSTMLKKVIEYVFDCPYEVSGYFNCTANNQLVPVISFEQAGMNYVYPKNELRTIFFHTHPKVCYDYYGSFCGLPSPADMISLIHDYLELKSIFCFVFAVEGIYSWQLTKSMMAFLRTLKLLEIPNQQIDLLKKYIEQTFKKSGFFKTFQKIQVDQFHPFQTPKDQYVINGLEHAKHFEPLLHSWFQMLDQLTIGLLMNELVKHLSETHKNTLIDFTTSFQLTDEKIYQFQYTSYLSFSQLEEHTIILDVVL